MALLHEVIELCLLLESDKIKQRRDAFKDLVDRIAIKEFRDAIDTTTRTLLVKHGDTGIHKKVATWNFIVSSVVTLLDNETRNAADKQAKLKKTPLPKEITSALRHVIKIADGRGPMLFGCIHEILRHIVATLKTPFGCKHFGTDYCAVLSDMLLVVPAYCHLIQRNTFDDLLGIFVGLLLPSSGSSSSPPTGPPSSFELRSSAKVLQTLIESYPFDLKDFFEARLGSFFAKFFADTSWGDHILLPVLHALNHVIRESGAVNCSAEVRKLHASIGKHILDRWRTTRDAQLKEQCVLFFRLSIRVYAGPFSTLTTTGVSIPLLYELHEALVAEISSAFSSSHQSRKFRQHKQPSSAQGGIRHDDTALGYYTYTLLDLAADVFIEHATNIPLASGSFSHHSEPSPALTADDEGPKRKRRKVCTVWDPIIAALRDDLSTSTSTALAGSTGSSGTPAAAATVGTGGTSPLAALPWVQLLCITTEKHPTAVPEPLRAQFVSDTARLLDRTAAVPVEYATEFTIWILRALQCFAVATARTKQPDSATLPVAKVGSASRLVGGEAAWSAVWAAVVRRIPLGISSPSDVAVSDACLTTLRTLLDYDLVEPSTINTSQDALWKAVVFNDARGCTSASVLFVLCFVARYELQELASSTSSTTLPMSVTIPTAVPTASVFGTVSETRRERLVRWILGMLEHQDPGWHRATSATATIACYIDPALVAACLAALVRPGPCIALYKRFVQQHAGLHIVEHLSEAQQSSEQQIREIQSVRKLLSIDAADAAVTVSAMATSRNQISVPLRLHLQQCVVCGLAKRGQQLNELILDIAKHKRKTLGIDKNQMEVALTKAAHVGNIIVHILPLLNLPKHTGSEFAHSQKGATQIANADVPSTLSSVSSAVLIDSLPSLMSSIAEHLKLISSSTEQRPLLNFVTHLRSFLAGWKQTLDAAEPEKAKSVAKLMKTAVAPLLQFLLDFVAEFGIAPMEMDPLMSTPGGSHGNPDDMDIGEASVQATTSRSSNGDAMETDIDILSEANHSSAQRDSELCLLNTCRCLSTLLQLQLLSHQGAAEALTTLLQHRPVDIKAKAAANTDADFEALWCLHHDPESRVVVLERLLELTHVPELFGDESFRHRVLQLLTAMAVQMATMKPSPPKELSDACVMLVNEFIALWNTNKLHWRTRLRLGECLSELLPVDIPSLELPNVFLRLLADADFRVRVFMTKAATLFFSLFNDEKQIFSGICEIIDPQLSTDSANVEQRTTALLTLGEIACVSAVNEREILFRLCCYARQCEIAPIVRVVVSRIAHKLGYKDIRALYEDHLSAIIGQWLRKGLALRDFPVWLLTSTSAADSCDGIVSPLAEFIARYQPIVFSRVVLQLDRTQLEELARLIGKSPADTIRDNFAAIFARSFPFYFLPEHKSRGEEICGIFLQQFVDVNTIHSMVPQELDTIIMTMCDLIVFPGIDNVDVSTGDRTPEPLFRPATITAVLEHLAKGFKLNTVSEMLRKSRSRMQKLLLFLKTRFVSTHRRGERERLIEVIALFIDLLGPHVCKPSIFRDVVHTILRAVADDSLQSKACALLLKVCHVTMAANGVDLLTQQLGAIVTALIPAAQRSALADTNPPLDVLRFLIVESHDQLRDAIKALQPLPEGELFRELNSVYFKLRSTLTLAEELSRFVETTSVMHVDTATRTAALHHLRDVLRTRHSAVRNLSNGDAGSRALLSQLTWELIKLCGDRSAAAIGCCPAGSTAALAAAECLGELGVTDPHAIAFVSFSNTPKHKKAQPGSITDKLPQPSAIFVSGAECLLLAKCGILLLLNAFLTDASVAINTLAAKTLRDVLTTDSGRTACAILSKEVQDLLAPFQPGSSALAQKLRKQPDTGSPGSASYLVWSDTVLWRVDGKTYDEWLCQLTAALARYAAVDEVFRLCANMCKESPRFAEYLFAFLVYDILVNDKPPQQPARTSRYSSTPPPPPVSASMHMAKNFREFLLQPEREPSLRANSEATHLALSTLTFLRKMTQLESQRGRQSGGGGGGSASSDSPNLAAANDVTAAPAMAPLASSLLTEFWAELDLLAVAVAAQNCSAYLTSLLYVELWCEREFGQLRLPDNGWDEADPNGFVTEGPTMPLSGSPTLSPAVSPAAALSPNTTVSRQARSSPWRLLLDNYSNINEPDAVYGINQALGEQSDLRAQLTIYSHEGDWLKTISAYDRLLSVPTPTSAAAFSDTLDRRGLLTSLHNAGYHHLLHMYLAGVSADYPDKFAALSEFAYEQAWRACRWALEPLAQAVLLEQLASDAPEGALSISSTTGREVMHSDNSQLWTFVALRALSEGDRETFSSGIQRARLDLARLLGNSALESTKNVHPMLTKLQCFSEIEATWPLRWMANGTARMTSSADVAALLHQWEERLPGFGQSANAAAQAFAYVEPLLSLHGSLLRLLGNAGEEVLTSHLVRTATLARKAGRQQLAMNAICHMRALARADPLLEFTSALEEAKVLWATNEADRAIGIARSVISKLESGRFVTAHGDSKPGMAALYADALLCAGKWIGQTRTESASTVVSMYLEKAAMFIAKSQDVDMAKLATAYFTLGRFCDGLYQSLVAKLSSAEWQISLDLRKTKEAELRKCEEILKTPAGSDAERQELTKHVILLRRQVELDRQESARPEQDKNTFLRDALRNYLLCVSTADTPMAATAASAGDMASSSSSTGSGVVRHHGLRAVFRLCSLWFEHCNSADINALIRSEISRVPSYKFLELIYQIASRLGSGSDEFHTVLTALLERLATEHPHHSLYVLFALANGNRISAGQKGRQRYVVDDDKIKAAKDMIAKLRSSGASGSRRGRGANAAIASTGVDNVLLPTIIGQMEQLIEAYIELAFMDVSAHKKSTSPIKLPTNLLRKVRELTLVPVPTRPLGVSPSAKYNAASPDFVYVASLDDTFRLVGGLNLPKIVKCRGSDGRSYKQLVKGNDDLRQDAVMQQLFGVANMLLAEDGETRRRRLQIRTYKVIPLTPCAGVLEWVRNTIPLGTYLIGSAKNPFDCAHVRYRPSDALSIDCRKEMMAASDADKRRVYADVTKKFRPVFHHFFLEYFHEPAEWFERRLTYTRSAATSSIVGYIVGLGDRHSQNILIDKSSGELVHIDLGVSFEQGKTLRTPEVVPFRLTRDVVDGMGITGCEGVFRRCCEATMRVLRANQESLLTILEVFIHDPLYRWALSPIKALQLQREDDDVETGAGEVGAAGAKNIDAERALFRLKQKLQGFEYGEPLSVEGQVKQLINEARDPERLCRMFYGWAPWI